MPTRLAVSVLPIVEHAYLEYLAGAPVTHALWEAALAGAFHGAGYPYRTALQAAERMEQALGLAEPAAFQRAELAALARGMAAPAFRPRVLGIYGPGWVPMRCPGTLETGLLGADMWWPGVLGAAVPLPGMPGFGMAALPMAPTGHGEMYDAADP